MPNLSIKDVPEGLAEALRRRAAQNHRSLQGELMSILEAAERLPVHEVREPVALAYEVGAPVAAPAPLLPPAFVDKETLPARFAAIVAANGAAHSVPQTREARRQRLVEIAAQVAPSFRAADRLTREQANDRAFLHDLGL